MRCSLCGFYIIKPQTALHHAVQCTVTCGAVRLYHFTGGFGVVFAVCTVLVNTPCACLEGELILNFHFIVYTNTD